MRVVILEPSVIGHDRSHGMSSLIGCTFPFSKQNIEVVWVTNRQFKSDSNSCETFSLFDYTIYDDVRSESFYKNFKVLRKLRSYLLIKRVESSLDELQQALRLKSSDHILVPTVDWVLFRALLNWKRKNEIKASFHFRFVYQSANWMTGLYPYKRMKGALDLWKDKGDLFLYTETFRHAHNLSEETGLLVEKFPHPALPLGAVDADNGNIDSDKVYVGFLGGGRRDKGFHLIPDIVKKVQKINNNLDIVFWVQRPREEDDLSIFEDELEVMENVVLLPNQLDIDEYAKRMMFTSVLVFPYSHRGYYDRGSGIINEALANAVPFVCTADTSLAESITHSNGLEADYSNFGDAIYKVCSELKSYKLGALKAREFYLFNLDNNPVVRNIMSGG